MAKKGKNVHHDEHIDESWLVPYADLMTLLLALFIVLFAASTVDEAKYQAMREAFFQEFNGVLPEKSNTPGLFDETAPPVPTPPPATEGGDGPQQQINQLADSFQTYVEENNLSQQMQITETEDGLLITLTSDVWFPPGSAAITQTQTNIAKEVADMITKNQSEYTKLDVIVSGHTDNTPIHTTEFESNWHLSVARAVNFMEALIDQSSLNPANYSARGLGEYEPVDTNDTPEGRQHNRRVEVYISPSGA